MVLKETAVVVAGSATVAVVAVSAPWLLPWAVQTVGFGTGGIAGGSTAAAIMSTYAGNAAAGSMCAVLQSIGATGTVPTCFAAAANVVVGIAGCTSLVLGAVGFFRKRSSGDGAVEDNPESRDGVAGDNSESGNGVTGDNSGSIAGDDPACADGAAGDKSVSFTGDKPESGDGVTGDKPASVAGNNSASGDGDGAAGEKPTSSWPFCTWEDQMGSNLDGVAGGKAVFLAAGDNHVFGDADAGDEPRPIYTWEHQLGSDPAYGVGVGVAGDKPASADGDGAVADKAASSWPIDEWQHQLSSDPESGSISGVSCDDPESGDGANSWHIYMELQLGTVDVAAHGV